VGPYVQLRPLEGGKEWDVSPERVELVTLSEALSGAIANLNDRSQRGF
jgi:hypothetical protein